MKFYEKIFYCGIWIQPIVLYAIYLFIQIVFPGVPEEAYPWASMIILSVLPSIHVYSKNALAKKAGQEGFGPEDVFARPTAYHSAKRQKAMYPPVNQALLHKIPEGIVLGRESNRFKSRYICKRPDDDGHILIIGGSGSGKSSAVIIPSLMAMVPGCIFCLDIKGELSLKSRKVDDPGIRIVDPMDRKSWGWNPLYMLNDTSTEQRVYECMQEIAYSLIPLPADAKEPFWKINARNLLTGLLVGYYKRGKKNFIQLVDTILECAPQDSIKDILEFTKSSSVEKKLLSSFEKLADDTMSGIVSEVSQHLTIFVDSDVRYCFETNIKKADPEDITEKAHSVFVCIREEKLSAYYDVLQLIINQVLSALERREEDAKPCAVVIDELPRLVSQGKIERLMDAVHTLRSRKVTLVMVTQSLEALETAYTRQQVADMVANCGYIACLDVKSQETAKTICSLAGTYKETERSWSGEGPKQKVTISYKDQDILTPADLSQLINKKEIVLITPYGYAMAAKTPYYKDPWFAKKAEKIKKYNLEVKKIEKEIIHL